MVSLNIVLKPKIKIKLKLNFDSKFDLNFDINLIPLELIAFQFKKSSTIDSRHFWSEREIT